jgi:integrase
MNASGQTSLPDRNKEFLLVRSIRQFASLVNYEVSKTTEKDYETKFARMKRTGFLPEHANTKRGYFAYRAAMLFCTAKEARQILRTRDKAVYGTFNWQQAMNELARLHSVFRRYPPKGSNIESPFSWKDVKAFRGLTGLRSLTRSKKYSLTKVRKVVGWRETLLSHITPVHKLAAAVVALTGARPSEVARGIKLRIQRHGTDDLLFITIPGTKITATAGQPERVLSIRTDTPIASFLVACLRSSGLETLTISTCPANLCAAMIKAGRKAFPKLKETISPYTLRHAFASDLKAAGVGPEIIAAALGHRATETQQYYGYAICASGRLPVEAVRASLPVRLTHRDPFASIAANCAPSMLLAR